MSFLYRIGTLPIYEYVAAEHKEQSHVCTDLEVCGRHVLVAPEVLLLPTLVQAAPQLLAQP